MDKANKKKKQWIKCLKSKLTLRVDMNYHAWALVVLTAATESVIHSKDTQASCEKSWRSWTLPTQ